MNLFTKKLSFLVIIAAVAVSGCSKKPKRPDPSSTILGPGGLSTSDVTGLGVLGGDGTLADAGSMLGGRDGVIDEGDKIRGLLEPVYFDFNQSALKASERSKLETAKKYLNDHPEQRILLEGHCDWRGTAEYNLGLGDRRASAAKQYLETLGVPAARIEVLSKGDLDSVENADETAMSKDRRAELVVLKK
jgi:peptidoglycan-associated lipoprotein